jgi:tripartite-type tricarboxylate transporter receptor subunit TctC
MKAEEDAMSLSRRRVLQVTAAASALPSVSRSAAAQAYPSRPITIINPFPAGGPMDAIAGVIGEHMRGTLGQPLIVESLTGAAGILAVGRVARALPDGYTMGIGNFSSHVVNGATYALQYDLRNGFEPVALLVSNSQLIISKNAMPIKDLKELVVWLKQTLTRRRQEQRVQVRSRMSLGCSFRNRRAHVSNSYPIAAFPWQYKI